MTACLTIEKDGAYIDESNFWVPLDSDICDNEESDEDADEEMLNGDGLRVG